MNEDNAADGLLKFPREGEEALLVEGCKILGFKVVDGGVYHDNLHLARIQDKRLVIVNEEAVKDLSYDLPPLTLSRKIKLNEIYFQLCEERIAIHEAGHAVAAIMRQVPFCFVRIGVQQELHLCSKWNRCSDDYSEAPWIARDKQYVLAAGAAAEKLVFDEYHESGVAADREGINVEEVMLLQAKGVEAPDGLDVFDDKVNEVVAELAVIAVRAVAKLLVERQFLSHSEVEQIVEEIEAN